ncbi:alaserpin-like [Venturia canescens]|uniref:alaserpin-like n=1 Tax=Venturia canescens TaxID=32260 RepID=UPI001C9BD087|nr:alaserpin-like [Venturia canescens]
MPQQLETLFSEHLHFFLRRVYPASSFTTRALVHKMPRLFLLGALLLHVAASNAAQPEAPGALDSRVRQYALNTVTRDSKRFSSKLVQEVAKIDSKNQVVSPLGLSLTLAMASFGARRKCQNIFQDVVGTPFITYTGKVGYQALIDYLASYRGGVELRVANGVFLSSKIQPKREFIEVTAQAFRSAVQKIEFEKSTEAVNTINEWSRNRTNGHVESVLQPGDVNEDTSMVLVTAVYFKGTWMKNFVVENTREQPFYLEDGTEIKIPTMSVERSFRYGEYPEADAKFVELPYKTEDAAHNMSMYIILPNKKSGLKHLEKNFHQITVQQLIARGTKKKVYIHLPKFKIESEIDLKEPLSRMGMSSMFDPREADFSDIVTSPRLYVTKIVQKSVIEINEEGCEAASSSAVAFSSRSSFDSPTLFFADHAFYVCVVTTGANPQNIFTARFTGQEEEKSARRC